VRLLPRLSWSWTVLLPSDTYRKLITSTTAVLLPFVAYSPSYITSNSKVTDEWEKDLEGSSRVLCLITTVFCTDRGNHKEPQGGCPMSRLGFEPSTFPNTNLDCYRYVIQLGLSILNFETRWRWFPCFTLRLLYSHRKSARYSLVWRLGGPQSRPECCREERNLFLLPEIESRYLGFPSGLGDIHNLLSTASSCTFRDKVHKPVPNLSSIFDLVSPYLFLLPGCNLVPVLIITQSPFCLNIVPSSVCKYIGTRVMNVRFTEFRPYGNHKTWPRSSRC
jgi:hypothetical protein